MSFSIASNILTDTKEFIGVRDSIFNEVLSSFDNDPVSIFQVGAIETFKDDWRYGSGWSDIIFGKYIKKNGGKLVIVDIDMDHLSHSFFAACKMGYKVNVIFDDAKNIINQDKYDIYYLDGSNDPVETLEQFNIAMSVNDKAVFIVDDYSIKGTLLPDGFKMYDVANKVGVLDLRGKIT